MSGWRHAFSLSADEVRNAEPPGTVRLIEHESHGSNAHPEDHLVLIPHPSISPLDPLNWPRWRKWAVLMTMSLYAAFTSFGASILSPALFFLPFQVAQSRLSQLIAVTVLMQGVSNIFWVPLGNIFGRRPVCIAAMAIALAASIWAGAAGSFESLLAARVFQGVGFAVGDSVSPNVVAEIYFVHERGRAMTIYTLFLAGGSFLGPVVGSYIAVHLGYKYVFWITTAVIGFNFLCQIFLVPETLFPRTQYPPRPLSPDHNTPLSSEKGAVQTHQHISPDPIDRLTFSRSLGLGAYQGDVLGHFLAPWRTLLLPGTWVVMLHYGGLLGGVVTISTVGPMILAMPPYLWGANVGLIALGGLVGCLIGAVFNYFVIDGMLIGKAKKNATGLAEPETRLPAMIPALFLATTGIWTFGFSAAHHGPTAWAGLVVGFGMVGFGIMQVPSVGFNYLVDAYSAVAADCFVMTTIMRGVVSFAWTFFVGDWVAAAGPAIPFGVFGGLMGVFGLLLLPLYWFGKRMRIATASYLPDTLVH